ncbi:Nucleoside triphosphate pyrophosphohydrolase MazG (EC [Olavius algarvensis Delta 1 endosymbiont]|nr:Nucleoside triphosphate pyrophosphohydrolase MazG (EC [Olavius algarvensis Delta 1 endosymbiont]
MEDSILKASQSPLSGLIRLVEKLRGENGCPWDKKQTPQSVGIYLIEEVFELVDAIESGNTEQICEELGDVLFHIVFVARMFEERQEFDLSQVSRAITEKMIRRHPHVFGEKEVNSSAEVVRNWHQIKLSENKNSRRRSLFDSVPAGLPALMRAYRLADRAAKSGFEISETGQDRDNPAGLAEALQTAFDVGDSRHAARQFGDLIFALVNIARLAAVHPESALTESVKVFEARFKKMEELIALSKREFDAVSLDEKKRIWAEVLKIIP